MLLSIVTLNYKKPELTLACMASLHEQFKKEFTDGKIELIIIDNDSGDGSVEKLQSEIKKENYKNTQIIANKENSGFGKGCNIGANSAKGDFILFLNNDTITKDKGILNMAQYMQENSEVSILGGQLRNPDGALQPSSGKFYNLFNAILLLLGLQKFGLSRTKLVRDLLDNSSDIIAEVDWVKGGLFMIRKEVFKKLSGFDENIFMYTEDMELCYRARKKGFKTFFYPDVNIVHQEHGSANRSFAIVHIYKGLLYFYKKHKSYSEYFLLKILLFAKAMIAIIIGTIFRNSYLVTTYRKAINI